MRKFMLKALAGADIMGSYSRILLALISIMGMVGGISTIASAQCTGPTACTTLPISCGGSVNGVACIQQSGSSSGCGTNEGFCGTPGSSSGGSGTGAGSAQGIANEIKTICNEIKTVVFVLGLALMILGGALYAGAHVMPGTTKGQIQGYGMGMLVGGIIGVIIALIAPFVLNQIITFSNSGVGKVSC
ncbi:MAG: hypothetical protein KGH58_01920 [Candidatus Micrarchaeota archaeon]|nr:hypothetical protein [Candidatus Micrarchaeota archaeon]